MIESVCKPSQLHARTIPTEEEEEEEASDLSGEGVELLHRENSKQKGSPSLLNLQPSLLVLLSFPSLSVSLQAAVDGSGTQSGRAGTL